MQFLQNLKREGEDLLDFMGGSYTLIRDKVIYQKPTLYLPKARLRELKTNYELIGKESF